MRRLLHLLHRFGGWVSRLAHRITTRVHHIAVATTSRLVQRWHSDSVYRRTLIAAASALSATVLPHPAAAAAVGALLADHAPIGHRRRVEHEYSDWDEDDDSYLRRDPRRLWETFD